MTTYLGKSCSFCLPRVPFVNCRQFMYLVISLLVLRAGYGIWLYQFLIIAYLFTLVSFLTVSGLQKISTTVGIYISVKLEMHWSLGVCNLRTVLHGGYTKRHLSEKKTKFTKPHNRPCKQNLKLQQLISFSECCKCLLSELVFIFSI